MEKYVLTKKRFSNQKNGFEFIKKSFLEL